jgi:hypothetical protein
LQEDFRLGRVSSPAPPCPQMIRSSLDDPVMELTVRAPSTQRCLRQIGRRTRCPKWTVKGCCRSPRRSFCPFRTNLRRRRGATVESCPPLRCRLLRDADLSAVMGRCQSTAMVLATYRTPRMAQPWRQSILMTRPPKSVVFSSRSTHGREQRVSGGRIPRVRTLVIATPLVVDLRLGSWRERSG